MIQLTLAAVTVTGAALKEAGQSAMEQTDREFVTRMRAAAREISLASGFVTVENLRLIAASMCLEPIHCNSWGSVFRGPQWKIVGRKRSAMPTAHAREIKIWQWVP